MFLQHGQKALPDRGFELRIVHQVLDQADGYGQRGSQLMGHVGNEIAAHGLHALDLGHIARDEQAAIVGKGNEHDRITRIAVVAALDQQRFV